MRTVARPTLPASASLLNFVNSPRRVRRGARAQPEYRLLGACARALRGLPRGLLAELGSGNSGNAKLVGGEVEDITFSKIQKVLEVFDDQVTFLKKQYVKTIEKRDDFLDVGFLLTDYASDFYDGKQLTLCVYI